MLNLLQNQVNGVKLLSRRGTLVRWKPPTKLIRANKFARRKVRSKQKGRGHKVNKRLGISSSQIPKVKVTLVCAKNNFWGLLHEKGRLTKTISAGTLPGFEGSKRGRVQAAGGVALAVKKVLSRAIRSRRRTRSRKFRPRSQRRKRRPHRWGRRRRYYGRRGRIYPWGLNLVGWARDKRWLYAINQLAPRGRVLVGVHHLRSHNGLRKCSPRRH